MRKKTALITGGATGIGKRTASMLAEKGIQIVINYRNSENKAEFLLEELREKYQVSCISVQGDVTKREDCMRMIEEIKGHFPTIDIVVHNAGPFIHERKKMTEYSLEEWEYLINGNLNAVFYISKLIVPIMREQHWGRIITMGYDKVESAPGWIYRSAFAAAKSGIASLTRTIAIEEAPFGITANMVSPGDIIGDWKEKNIDESLPGGDAPIGRHGTGEDVARVISFLTDEKSDFITGSIIPVTGGLDVLGKHYRGS